MGRVQSTVAGNLCSVVSRVLSATPWYCDDVRLIFVVVVGRINLMRRFVRDVCWDGGDEVAAEPASRGVESRCFV